MPILYHALYHDDFKKPSQYTSKPMLKNVFSASPSAHLSSNSLRGVCWMLGWAFCINASMSVAKSLSPDVGNVMLIFIRNGFGTLFLLPMILKGGASLWQTQQPWRQILNGGVITVAMGCTYYAYRHLPLAFATSVGFSGPFITVVLAKFFLKEKITGKKWCCIIVGYLGVLIALSPAGIAVNHALAILVLANVLAAINIINRRCLLRTDSPQTILVLGSIMGMILTGIGSLFFWVSPSLHDLGCLILIGGFGISSHYCYLKALEADVPSFVAPFEYARLVLAVPIGIILFQEMPELNTMIGSLLVIASGIWLIRIHGRLS